MSGLSPEQSLIRLAFGFIPSRAIYVAAKLGIADLLDRDALSAQDLAQSAGVDRDALYRVLRCLAGVGILHETEDKRFSLTRLGETLRRTSPRCVADYVILYHELPYKLFGKVLHSVNTGRTACEATFGKPFFEFLESDNDASRMFQAGLASRTRIDIEALLEAYDFSSFERIVDVGGGNGALLSTILTRYERPTGVLLERSPAIQAAKAGRGGVLPRCELVQGDFFNDVPAGGDLYILKLVLHDWNDTDAIRILRCCRSSMATGSRLLVIEGLISRNTENLTNFTDLNMLVTVGGIERTESQYRSLMHQAGLALNRTIMTQADLCILEATPV
jgi:hypothetical protein